MNAKSIIILATCALASAALAWNQAQIDLPRAQLVPNTPDRVPHAGPPRVRPELPNGLRHAPLLLTRLNNRLNRSSHVQVAGQIPSFANYSFVNINVANSPFVVPFAVNDAGIVAGSYSDASGAAHGFVWKNGTAKTLDYPGAASTEITGVNNRGILIGFYVTSDGSVNLVTYSLTLSTWSVLPEIPGFPFPVEAAINDNGVAVGIASDYFAAPATWIWHPDSQSYSFFTAPGANEASTYGAGINEQSQIVGDFNPWSNALVDIAFLREGCKEQDEDTDEECAYKQIAVPGSVYGSTVLASINNRAAIAGYFEAPTFYEYGFVRTASGVFKIVNYAAFAATAVYGISDHGVVCGDALTSSDQYQAFVAFPN